jgi:protein O-mannosyl-transferase
MSAAMPQPLPRRHLLRWLGPCAIMLACLACYWPALDGEVLWDDPAHLTAPELRTMEGLARIWTDLKATQQYYPVLHTAFWLEHKIWGDAVRGYHLINVMQHALACCLLALVLQRLRTPRRDPPAESTANRSAVARSPVHPTPVEPSPRTDWFAWGGALLLAVHPVCVESVAWISEQKNTLSTLFYFGAALAWLRFAETRRPAAYVTASLCFLLAVGSKTVTCTLPAALLVVQWWRHGRLDARRDVVPLLPWFGLAIAAGLGTAWIERNLIGAEGADYALTFVQRLLLAGRIVWFYVGSVVWPADLAFFYERWDVAAAATGWWPFLVATLATTIVFWSVRRRTRGPLAAWLLWVGTLFPALGFFNVFPFAFSYVADHFQYLATFGLIGAAAIGVASWCERSRHRFRPATTGALAAALCLLFAALSRAESRHYQNNLALFSASVAVVPGNWMAQRCLGWAWSRIEGREAEAVQHYTESLRLNPDSRDPERVAEATALLHRSIELRPHFAEPRVALARLLRDQPDRMDEMIEHLRIAVATKPRYAEAHRLLADALSRLPDRQADALTHYLEALRWNESLVAAHLGLGRLQSRLPGRESEAAARFQQALALDPQNAAAHFELANLLAGRPETAAAAEQHYAALLRLQPAFPAAHFNYANLLARLPGRAHDALRHYEAALALEPDSADIHGNLGNTYGQLGRTADAIASYRRALALAPDLPWVHQNLALALAPLPGQSAQALRHATEAVRLAPRNPTSHNTLAIVYAQQGSLTKARDAWQKVLELDPQFAPARENLARVNQLLNR